LLLISGVCELEWQIRGELEDWAEVASLDPPGVGASPGPWSPQAASARALAVVEERGWSDFALVVDAWGAWYLPGILDHRSEDVTAVALGHAALSAEMGGDRPVRRLAIWDALTELVAQGQEQFASSTIAQLTRDGISEKLAKRIMERMPVETFEAMLEGGRDVDVDLGPPLRELDVPLLLAKHEDCLLYTDEGFADAVEALPGARTCVTEKACPADEGFAAAVRSLCAPA
jgi:hypothetical protein